MWRRNGCKSIPSWNRSLLESRPHWPTALHCVSPFDFKFYKITLLQDRCPAVFIISAESIVSSALILRSAAPSILGQSCSTQDMAHVNRGLITPETHKFVIVRRKSTANVAGGNQSTCVSSQRAKPSLIDHHSSAS